MTREKLFYTSSKLVRDSLNLAVVRADQIHEDEKKLIKILYEIDQNRFYVRYGYKTLMGFCNNALKFSKTQSQRLVTAVRRYEPTSNFGINAVQPVDDCH